TRRVAPILSGAVAHRSCPHDREPCSSPPLPSSPWPSGTGAGPGVSSGPHCLLCIPRGGAAWPGASVDVPLSSALWPAVRRGLYHIRSRRGGHLALPKTDHADSLAPAPHWRSPCPSAVWLECLQTVHGFHGRCHDLAPAVCPRGPLVSVLSGRDASAAGAG